MKLLLIQLLRGNMKMLAIDLHQQHIDSENKKENVKQIKVQISTKIQFQMEEIQPIADFIRVLKVPDT